MTRSSRILTSSHWTRLLTIGKQPGAKQSVTVHPTVQYYQLIQDIFLGCPPLKSATLTLVPTSTLTLITTLIPTLITTLILNPASTLILPPKQRVHPPHVLTWIPTLMRQARLQNQVSLQEDCLAEVMTAVRGPRARR